MRILNIILLHFQQVFHHRLRSFVWFCIPLMNNLTLILFWAGSLKDSPAGGVWTLTTAATYYVLLTIAGSLLTSHIEEDVAVYDIQYGDLARYLTKPFPYFWIKFIEEIPYRILQGFYGLVILLFVAVFFRGFISLTGSPVILVLTGITIVLAYFLSFTMKMNWGLSAFWFKDSRGCFELLTIVVFVFSGGIVPLYLLPSFVRTISYFLPFSYMAYFPIIGLQGQLHAWELVRVILIQSLWLGTFVFLNRFMWNRGIKQFTAFGQ